MFFEIELTRNVVVPADKLYTGLLLKRSIILQLIDDVSHLQADEEYGYYIAVTTLEGVGEGKIREITGSVVFPVKFKCIVFKPFVNEVLDGRVGVVTKLGIILSCGPMKELFIPAQNMRDFEFISGANPMYRCRNLNVEKGSRIRFQLMGLKWIEQERIFRALGTLAGDYLGPIYDIEMNAGKESIFDAGNKENYSQVFKTSSKGNPVVVIENETAPSASKETNNDPSGNKETNNEDVTPGLPENPSDKSDMDIDTKAGIKVTESEKVKPTVKDYSDVTVIELD